MKVNLPLVLLFFFGCANIVSGQTKKIIKNDTAIIVKDYIDSLRLYNIAADSTASYKSDIRRKSNDGRFFRLFAPLTFYHSSANKQLVLNAETGDKVCDEIDKTLIGIYLNRPDLVINSEANLKKTGSLRKDIDKPIRQEFDFVNKSDASKETPMLMLPANELVIEKPNFWSYGCETYLQFMQNYVSENWHKGGESNYSMVGSVTMNANYNNKSGLKFDNKLELKLGFLTSRDDTLHKFKTTEDMIRYTGKVGIQATKGWYYTLQLLAYTQFTQGHKSNDKQVYSDFMSPFNLNLGLGMDYSISTKNKVLTGNINISLLSFNFRYVDRKDLAGRYGVVGDHHTLEDFGSQLTLDLTWNIFEQLKWKTRFYGYTTYERAQIDWENTITLNFSKYISANIFIYPRFDDSTKRDDSHGYWQFKEYCSLGFSYGF